MTVTHFLPRIWDISLPTYLSTGEDSEHIWEEKKKRGALLLESFMQE